jgi:hypothetical protein
MNHEDPWPDPLDAKRLEREREEQHPDPLPGYGLGSGRLGEYGLGADRLKHAGLGEHHPPAHGHGHTGAGHHAHDHTAPIPGVHYRGDEAHRMPEKAQLVSPIPHDQHHKVTAPPKLPPPLYSGSIDRPVHIRAGQIVVALIGVAAVVLLAVLLLRAGPGRSGQFGELGSKLAQGPARSYKYVADFKRQLYWPNDQKYVEAIPKANRMYIHDDADLAGYSNYKPGKL